ncbi:pyridoxamine 5'-phosphate oxidase family protein [Natronorubrum sulfidifaciens]|uniref:Pyridoxamine 5'-phosphate oxidase family protein n=1 Tax=Natronorubrum sulfidifaciens JCM 14089 TaxID=1230460 RepID=L9W8E8_9EURY|nr:pyridoxamine 5'-phosphate oxidase family protein [Natronorubrum sulfidifaciens]ELY44588.1 hypothetical protein C495_11824 [Natronorubrum sulfidifaciens JCM 14089]
MDKISYEYTFGMDETAIDETLQDHEVGVLALADDSSAYAVPVAYHYDGSSLYIRLTSDGSSTKMAFLEATADACLCLYNIERADTYWSIIVRGPVRKLTDDEQAAFDETAVNESFRQLPVFDQDVEDLDVEIYELEMETVTGRERGA